MLKTPRHLLLEGKLVGYIDGEDTRSICGACQVSGVKSLQIYSTPYVLDALIHIPIEDEDVIKPKRVSADICRLSNGFNEAQVVKEGVSEEGSLTADQVWEMVYKILEHEYSFSEKQEAAIEILNEYDLFDEDKLRDLLERDIGVKFRLSWLGLIYSIYADSIYKE